MSVPPAGTGPGTGPPNEPAPPGDPPERDAGLATIDARASGPDRDPTPPEAAESASPHVERTRRIRELLESSDDAGLLAFLEDLHPSDVADLVEELDEEQRLHVIGLVPAELGGETLAEMDPEERPEDLLVALDPERITELLGELPDDDAADLLGELDPYEQARVLDMLPRRDAVELRRLLAYEEDSAGGIMTTELVAVSAHATAAEALADVRRQARGLEDDFFAVFAVDLMQRLVGTVRLQDLVLAEPDARIEDLLEAPVATVPVDMDQEEVARIIARYNLPAIAVVSADGLLLGRITFDDVIDVIEAEQTEDILRLAGASEDEEVRGGWLEAVRSRLPWLTLNIATIGLSSVAIWVFEDVVAAVTALVALLPIVMALGGNAGTQALAVTIRRIALGEETASRRWKVAGKEMLVGLFNGLVLGIIAAGIVWAWQGRAVLGAIVLFALWGNLVVASFAGAFVPIVLERMGVDPAVASSVFVTALTDLCGVLLLLGLGTMLLL